MYHYKIIRSKRKTISLQINDDCEIVVRAPFGVSESEIEKMVSRNADWIEKHMPIAKSRKEREDRITPELLHELSDRALVDIPPRVAKYAAIMGVEPTGIKITTARKRFGSCSGRNSLCFSCLLMLYPSEAVDSVVVHELAHIRHHNHSPAFYDFILSVMPDYRERERILKRPPDIR
jgi:Predicted metal-dependent hydrolase